MYILLQIYSLLIHPIYLMHLRCLIADKKVLCKEKLLQMVAIGYYGIIMTFHLKMREALKAN